MSRRPTASARRASQPGDGSNGLLVVVVAGIAFLLGAFWVVSGGGTRTSRGAVPGSVFNPAPDGLSLAYGYLRERARQAGGEPMPGVLSRRPRLGTLPPTGVLFRIRPVGFSLVTSIGSDAPDRLLTAAERSWVLGGGRLVLGATSDHGPLRIRPAPIDSPPRKVFPIWPGVSRVEPSRPHGSLAGDPIEEAHAVFAVGDTAILSRAPLGEGEVVLLAVPEVLENGRLADADHLRLLEALAGEGRPVLFDEWAHGLGHDGGLLERMLAWGLGPSLAVGALSFGLALWRSRARLGPPEPGPEETRSEAVDLVDSLAQLYERALSRREAADLHARAFRRAVAARTGLNGRALDRRVEELLDGALPRLPPTGEIAATEFARRLSHVNDGYRRLHEHVHPRRRP